MTSKLSTRWDLFSIPKNASLLLSENYPIHNYLIYNRKKCFKKIKMYHLKIYIIFNLIFVGKAFL